MPPIAHPGRLLQRELAARGLSANRLTLDLGVPSGRITDILNGRADQSFGPARAAPLRSSTTSAVRSEEAPLHLAEHSNLSQKHVLAAVVHPWCSNALLIGGRRE